MRRSPTKILLANYPKLNQTALFEQVGGKDRLDIFTGYDIQVDSREVTKSIIRDLVLALLTYDEVWLLGNNVTDVMQVWGADCLKEFLRLHILKVVPDSGMNPVLKRDPGGEWRHDFFGYSTGSKNLGTGEDVFFSGPFGNVENWMYQRGMASSERNAIEILLEENSASIDTASLEAKAMAETERDLQSFDFLTDPEFYRVRDGNAEYNMLSTLRLHHLNTLSVVAATMEADGLKTDGAIASLMRKKTRSVLSRAIPDGVEALNAVSLQKGFPDLGQLVFDGVISLNDLLKLRKSMQGRMFRYWAASDKYEEELMRKDIMNSVQSVLTGRIGTALRMMVCSLVGIAGFLPGLVASATDSFIVNKIAGGWHPNMFLDDKLKRLIDDRIAAQGKARAAAEATARFKGVQRNDPCPCGSGKKFKYCHGRKSS